MASKNFRNSRLTASDSLGSQIFKENLETAMAAQASANEFESLFSNIEPTPEDKAEVTIMPSPQKVEIEAEPAEKQPTKKEAVVKAKKETVSEPKKEKKKETVHKQAAFKDAEYLSAKRGRKKIYVEERADVFAKCGKICKDKMTDLRYKEKKEANTYLCDLMRREKEAYEKNPDSYVVSRRKKAEILKDADKGAEARIIFKVDSELKNFMDDIVFDIRCSKELFIRTVIDMEYDKKFK